MILLNVWKSHQFEGLRAGPLDTDPTLAPARCAHARSWCTALGKDPSGRRAAHALITFCPVAWCRSVPLVDPLGVFACLDESVSFQVGTCKAGSSQEAQFQLSCCSFVQFDIMTHTTLFITRGSFFIEEPGSYNINILKFEAIFRWPNAMFAWAGSWGFGFDKERNWFPRTIDDACHSYVNYVRYPTISNKNQQTNKIFLSSAFRLEGT